MLTLILIGLLSGIVTGLSPCILPVLPAVLATSAIPPAEVGPAGPPAPDRRRPFVVISGLVTSFAVFTLIGAALLSALHLPADLLRNIGIAAIGLLGIGFLIPAVGHVLERPFARFGRVGPRRSASAFAFGAMFGLAFVPCAGPVLATITVLAATNGIRAGLVVLTAAFSVGVAIPLLAIALAGQQMAERIQAVRRHMPLVRRVTGAILVATALAILLGASDQVQRLVPSYVATAQAAIEDNVAARAALGSLSAPATHAPVDSAAVHRSADLGDQESFDDCAADPSVLANCGPAVGFLGIEDWLNTPDGKPLSLDALRGRVVLVDFWTYSCINCQRTLPYLTAWDAKYRDAGLTVIGVHTPEFAFEHDIGNVTDQADRLGVRYPIAVDNSYTTWSAYGNRYWPAHYLIDRQGVVRQVHYGEGAYDETEALIRKLLDQPALPASDETAAPATGTEAADRVTTPTRETYLGPEHAEELHYVNWDLELGRAFEYTRPRRLPMGSIALEGVWTLRKERVIAGRDARLRLRYSANQVFAVLGGEGTLEVSIDGGPVKRIRVHGAPTLYPLDDRSRPDAVLSLSASPGVSAYSFTFG